MPKRAVFNLCEDLWQSGYLEESFIACSWAYRIHRKYEPADFAVFESGVSTYVSNWASCDTLCNHAVGQLIEMCPSRTSELKRWAALDHRWVRRGAAVSLIIPARQGLFPAGIFDIANILLPDSNDLVQKGYGWPLSASSQSNPKAVFYYVMSKKQVMPRVVLRYAIEKMPKELESSRYGKVGMGKSSGFRKN